MGMEQLVLDERGHNNSSSSRRGGLEIEDGQGLELEDEEEEEEEDEEEEDHHHKRIRMTNNNITSEDVRDDTNNSSTTAYVESPSVSLSMSQPEEEVMVIETMKPFHDPRKKVKTTRPPLPSHPLRPFVLPSVPLFLDPMTLNYEHSFSFL